jgi:hypothetical protein
MWHTLAFFKVDVAGAVNERIPAVRDQIVTQSPNGNYILQQDMIARAAYFRDAGAIRARLNTPDFRRVSIPNISPIQRQAGVTNLPAIERFVPANIKIPKIDEIIFEGSNNGAGGINAVGGLWISPVGDTVNIPPGDVYKLHGTCTTTGVAAGWELQSLVLDEILPAGNYTIIGFDAVQNGAVGAVEFARLAWTGGNSPGNGQLWRPGVLVRHGFNEQSWPFWTQGGWGVLGSFASTAPPQVEVFSAGGVGVGMDFFIDVVKIS